MLLSPSFLARSIIFAITFALSSMYAVPAQALDLGLLPGRSDYGGVLPQVHLGLGGADAAWTTAFFRHANPWFAATWWLDADGVSRGVVEQATWRQLFRYRLVYTDASDHVAAQGIQPWDAGVVWHPRMVLTMTDGNDHPLGEILGKLTWRGSRGLGVRNAQGVLVADVVMDVAQGLITVRHASGLHRVFATYQRTEQLHHSSQWTLSVLDRTVLPDATWPILAAFVLGQMERAEQKATPEVSVADGVVEVMNTLPAGAAP